MNATQFLSMPSQSIYLIDQPGAYSQLLGHIQLLPCEIEMLAVPLRLASTLVVMSN